MYPALAAPDRTLLAGDALAVVTHTAATAEA
jgi:hypothetical protein